MSGAQAMEERKRYRKALRRIVQLLPRTVAMSDDQAGNTHLFAIAATKDAHRIARQALRPKLIAVLLGTVALASAGCGPNIKGMVEHMSKSDRSWCLAASGYGVDLKVGGSGVDTGDMTCGGSGLVLRSQGAQVGVPLTIVPQLSVGPPALIPPLAPRPPSPAPRAVPQSAPAAPALEISWVAPAAAWKDTLPETVGKRHVMPTGGGLAGVEPGQRGFISDVDVAAVLRAVGAMHGLRP